ncbi:MAG: protein kinase [Candidatus Hydrogenedentota bacterium]|nr:MAG: protein kinase [Candidatus Hydrogenedentota bacterium]
MIGKTISHYRILEKLGEGGMGVVYKAEDTVLRRFVALKFPSAQLLGSEEEKTRFMNEARAAAQLDHPNICTLYEIGEDQGHTFISMAYVDGRGIDEELESGPVRMDVAIDIALQVSQGLYAAHRKGIIHRDIKSANVMVTRDGQVKIMDFGLAKLVGRTNITQPGTIMGTVSYMSPEQAGSEPIDHRTDMWSLGVVLYEMLTGELPFKGNSQQAVIYLIQNEHPPYIRDARSETPLALENAVFKMLQKNPADRYEDMSAVISELRTIKRDSITSVGSYEESPSIAVLPFINMSADPEQEYFCDGLAEELINALTKLHHLRVIARTSAFSFKGKNVNVRDIGRELDVGTILEGSVRKAGNRLRITAQLVDTARGHHLWSERYDREMDDIFAIQDEITLAIVDNLRPRLLGGEKERLVKRQTVDIEAYNLYLKGGWFFNTLAGEGLKKALEYFEKAIEKDPHYAPAHVGIARSFANLPLYSTSSTRDVFPKAKAAIQKALELDEELAEAHAVYGWIKMNFERDWEGADRECKRAIELNPGLDIAHYYYGMGLMFKAKLDGAVNSLRRAHELDPLSLLYIRQLGEVLSRSGRHDEAIDTLKKGLELNPNFPYMHFILGLVFFNMALYEEALAELEAERKVSRYWNPVNESVIGATYAAMGKRSEAQRVLDEFVERSKEENVSGFVVAVLCVALGEIDKAFEWLDKAYQEHDMWLSWSKIQFDTLRSDPRYMALLKKLGLDT